MFFEGNMWWKHRFSFKFHANLEIHMKIYWESYFLRKYLIKAYIFIDISWKSWNFNEMHWKCMVFIDFPGKNMVLHSFLSVSRFARKKGEQNTVVRQKPWNGPARRAWPEAPQAPEATYIESEIFKKDEKVPCIPPHKNGQKLYFGAHRI